MKTGSLVLLNLGVTVVVVAAAHALTSSPEAGRRTPPKDAGTSAPRPAVEGRIAALEAAVAELRGSLDLLRSDLAAEKEVTRERTEALRGEAASSGAAADPARALLDGAGVTAPVDVREKKPDLDAFAQEVSRAMKAGISQEFKRVADLVTAPTPEALDLRRRQIKMFASAMGINAGLDQAQIATFEGILNETDDRAREDLRPLLQGVDDYSKVDYPKVKTLTTDAFGAQDVRIEQEFPKERADSLKKQLEPIRNLFGAMLDELEKQGTAAK